MLQRSTVCHCDRSISIKNRHKWHDNWSYRPEVIQKWGVDVLRLIVFFFFFFSVERNHGFSGVELNLCAENHFQPWKGICQVSGRVPTWTKLDLEAAGGTAQLLEDALEPQKNGKDIRYWYFWLLVWPLLFWTFFFDDNLVEWTWPTKLFDLKLLNRRDWGRQVPRLFFGKDAPWWAFTAMILGIRNRRGISSETTQPLKQRSFPAEGFFEIVTTCFFFV